MFTTIRHLDGAVLVRAVESAIAHG